MPRQNRAFPDGTIRADPARGMFMGNRGCLHDATGAIRRSWQTRRWITCLTEFAGRKRQLMAPGRYTELFFMDEAVAAAAGHRPCAECRRAAHLAFREAWATAHGRASTVEAIDLALHQARWASRPDLPETALPPADLPEGALVLWQGQPHLVQPQGLRPWSTASYGATLPHPAKAVTVLTPLPLIRAMQAGWRVVLHPSAWG